MRPEQGGGVATAEGEGWEGWGCGWKTEGVARTEPGCGPNRVGVWPERGKGSTWLPLWGLLCWLCSGSAGSMLTVGRVVRRRWWQQEESDLGCILKGSPRRLEVFDLSVEGHHRWAGLGQGGLRSPVSDT